MTIYERFYTRPEVVARLLRPYPQGHCPHGCIYHNGSYCDMNLRRQGKTGDCEEGILAWLLMEANPDKNYPSALGDEREEEEED